MEGSPWAGFKESEVMGRIEVSQWFTRRLTVVLAAVGFHEEFHGLAEVKEEGKEEGFSEDFWVIFLGVLVVLILD